MHQKIRGSPRRVGLMSKGRSIGKIILYIALFIIVQLVVTMVYMAVRVFIMAFSSEVIGGGISGPIEDDVAYLTGYFIESANIDLVFAILISSIVTLLIVFLIYRKNTAKELDLGKMSIKNIGIVVMLGITLNILVSYVIYVFDLDRLSPGHAELMELLLGNSTFIITLLAMGIFGPILEEVIFRGIIYKELKKIANYWVAMILQALIFGVIHGNLLQGTYAFILGIIMAVIYDKSKSLVSAIIFHIAFNSASVIMYFAFSEAFLESMTIPLVIGSAVIAAVSSVVFYNSDPDMKEDVWGYSDSQAELEKRYN